MYWSSNISLMWSSLCLAVFTWTLPWALFWLSSVQFIIIFAKYVFKINLRLRLRFRFYAFRTCSCVFLPASSSLIVIMVLAWRVRLLGNSETPLEPFSCHFLTSGRTRSKTEIKRQGRGSRVYRLWPVEDRTRVAGGRMHLSIITLHAMKTLGDWKCGSTAVCGQPPPGT